MTALFKPPPAQAVPEQRIADLFTLGPANDPYWQQVRLAQLQFLERYLPFNVPIAIVNGAIVLATLSNLVDRWVLATWLVSQLLGIFLAVGSALAKARKRAPVSATRGELVWTLCQLVLVGSGWGLLFAQAMVRTDADGAMLIVAMTMAAIGCLAFTTSIWPLGAFAMSGCVVAGTVFGVVMRDWGQAWMISIVIVSFILFIARGNILTTFAFMSRLRTEARLIEQEQVIRLLLNEFEENGSEWLYEFDRNGSLTFVTSRFADAIRRPVDEVIGMRWTDFVTDRTTAGPLIEAARRSQPYRDVLLKVEVEGELRWWSISGTPKFDHHGELIGYRGVGSDVTERHRSAERIAELATFDALTGLVNRRIINQRLADGIVSEAGVALLFVDLDRFKAVNDSLGHGAGDRLLGEVAQRLRETVAEHGLVGRLGGDEFAVVLDAGDPAMAAELGARIIERVSQPYAISGGQALIGASVGLAVGPADGDSVEALMRAADLALYDVKSKGRGSVRHYDRAMHKQAEDRRSLEMDLKNALSAGQLRLAFQPVVDAMDERIVGFEALMRWRHPVHGDISPAVFIPIAEEAGLIGKMGKWALNEGCRVAATWPRHIKLAVNLSPLQFDNPHLVEEVRQALTRFNIQPQRLELELTESLFLDERAQTSAMLKALHAMGVGFALDDFGTGYSSLRYLQKIAFSRIKIDRSFVQASVAEGGESTAIIQAIVALADKLGMETTAEGTETRAEFEAMRRLGCAQIQGFFFGRPMPAEDVARLLDRTRPLITISMDDAEQHIGSHTGPRIEPALAGAFSPPPPSSQAAHGQWRTEAAPAIPPRRAAPPRTLRG